MIKVKYLYSVIFFLYVMKQLKKNKLKNYRVLTKFGWNSKLIRDKE